ncbi:MAG: EAL domain-containing protein, partial [Pseudomonadota bacterium]|nr:EAL domain-containing protein [Pseudomonadota bacterium]
MTGLATPYLLACATLLIGLIAGWSWSRRLAPLHDRALLQHVPLAVTPPPDPVAPTPSPAHAVFERNAAGLLMVDTHGLIVDANPALCELFAYARADLIGQPAALLHRGERPFKPFRGHGEGMSDGRGNLRAEQRFRRRDGGRLWCQIAGSSLELADGAPAMLWTVVDVDALHVAQEQVHHQALHDELTGLPNRRALDQQLPKAIARARRHGSVLALGVIDLDDFKPVNDTWGHEAGDRLLVEVATRLRRRLRESDLIVRSGGDEFVVLIEDLETGFVMQQLSELLQRLHGAVETTVEVVPGQQAKVDASIGLALFPLDVQDADGLQRLADAAMYQAKLQKHTRGVWWHRGAGSATPPEPEQPFDAYGAEAAQLMSKAGEHFEAVAQQFVDMFWSEIARTAPASAVLADFSADEVARLADHQVAHLRFLLDPATTRDAIAARAQRVGQVHALIGIGSEVMVQALALHRRILGEHLHGALLPARERYRILLGAESRLQDSMQAELRAMAATLNTWLDHLSEPLPAHGSLWPDARADEIGRLGALPGILGALVLRLNAEGVFNVEGSACPASVEIAQALLTPGAEAVVHPASPRGQGTTAQAWRTLEIRTSARYDRDPRYVFWQADARALGLRSTLSVPILNRHGQPVAMVSLFGAYPNQFESTSMQQFARGLQQRWQQVWLRCSTPATVVPLDVAQDYRHSLFSGGLRIHMQPVIDLRSGALVKVEGLARLERPDGSLLAPAEFLPLLGDAELDRLFRLGLDIVLSQLERWDAEGLHIDAALNLSPGTLLDRDCARWVEQALQRHGVAPRRLTLELLETDTLDASAQEDAIRRLLALGVQLSMDDLGTGHNNLERWARLPFDTIKVDQALLGRVHENPVLMLSLIRAFVQMGRDIEREVVVEGLEHAATIEAATILGAPFGQGYGLARPMPADQILAWSRQFTLAARGGEVRTALGALAQVWRCGAADVHGGPGHDPRRCPL